MKNPKTASTHPVGFLFTSVIFLEFRAFVSDGIIDFPESPMINKKGSYFDNSQLNFFSFVFLLYLSISLV